MARNPRDAGPPLNATPPPAHILVASDARANAVQIRHQLEQDFANIELSVDAAAIAKDFVRFAPDVLVLAFDSLSKARAYAAALYGTDGVPHRRAHVSIVLCNKDEVKTAFQLCKDGTFDDYVLYWPHAQDGLRLTMSVWNAARAVLAARPGGISRQVLLTHLKHLAELRTVLDEEIGQGRALGASAELTLRRAEEAIRAALEPLVRWPDELGDRLAPQLQRLWSIDAAIVPNVPLLLVVEDDEFARTLMREMVDPQRYTLAFAYDGASAQAVLRSVRPALIVMDINLPDIDGIELTQRLKKLPQLASIPVLMLSGEARRDVIANSLRAGAADFLVKPFTRDALHEKLDSLLAARATPPA